MSKLLDDDFLKNVCSVGLFMIHEHSNNSVISVGIHDDQKSQEEGKKLIFTSIDELGFFRPLKDKGFKAIEKIVTYFDFQYYSCCIEKIVIVNPSTYLIFSELEKLKKMLSLLYFLNNFYYKLEFNKTNDVEILVDEYQKYINKINTLAEIEKNISEYNEYNRNCPFFSEINFRNPIHKNQLEKYETMRHILYNEGYYFLSDALSVLMKELLIDEFNKDRSDNHLKKRFII